MAAVRSKKLLLSILLGISSLILLYLGLNSNMDADGGFIGYLGRFHPLIVHFPIVLVVLSLIIELVEVWRKDLIHKQLKTALLFTAIASSLLSAYLGYFLYQSGEYEGQLINDHMWGAIYLSLILSLAGIAALYEKKSFRIAGIILANLLLIYTGHLGGSLTHGENYLSEFFTNIEAEDTPILQKSRDDILVFEDLVLSVFRAKCLACHNENKAKGGLVMDSYKSLLAGGKSGKSMLDSLQAEEGELFKRLKLPLSHEEHMPPSGKAQLKEEEIAILDLWIKAGGKNAHKLGELNRDPALDNLIDAYIPKVAQLQVLEMKEQRSHKEISQELIPLAQDLGFVVESDSGEDSLKFILSMKLPPEAIGDEELIELLPYGDYISRISLISSAVTDDGLYTLGQLGGLKKIVLAKTCVNGSGLIYLAHLDDLKSLNLSESFLDDVGALELIHLKQLEEVYLLNAELSEKLRIALDEFLPNTDLKLEEGPLY
ncbi:MAG: c-type cytochrome domain-containing protein [Bacteroidia bacterium]|nr:c-type cytochrome domain-containing protein [Bacteroidia bacterium]